MTAKFDAFKAAYLALCVSHDAHIDADCEGVLSIRDGADFYGDIEDETYTPPTPEEVAAAEVAQREREKRWSDSDRAIMNLLSEVVAQEREKCLASPIYAKWTEIVRADNEQTRNEQMRVSSDPTDPAYIDARPRKVWCNEVEIEGWAVADEFRRCVITTDGKVHNGSVLIERLPDVPAPAEPAEPAAEPAPTKTSKRRR
jgi:hypothetical protein